MATAIAKVYVGGQQLHPYHIHVEQRSDWHHQFEITVSTEKANVLGGATKINESLAIDNAIAYAGETAEITIERTSGSFSFKGHITDVHIDQTYAGDAFIIFKGYAPTYLLEGQRGVASFEEKSLKDIFNDVMNDFPGNVQKEVNPKFTDVIPYVVRYKETQYQFLSRLAAIYGEWFYYDGQKIIFGDLPSKNPKVELTFGSDSMLSFNYGINLRPSNFKQQFYKYQDNGPVQNSVASYKPGWLDAHSKTSLSAANDLFTEEALDPVAHNITDNKHIKYISEAKKSSILSDVMVFTGQSADPGITVGAEVEVSSRNGFIGKYRVIAVTHSFDSNRDYYNLFKAIPASSVMPPVNTGVTMPLAEPQIGEVLENNDPEQLGRVRVKLKWQEGQTPWIRVLTNHASKGGSEGVSGVYFTPEIGDEVMVEFEQGNPDRPYVVGSKYHGAIPPEFADPDNNLKAIKTRSGHILQFDDKDGDESILITDKKGNLMKIETKGDNIDITAGNNITLRATNIKLYAEKEVIIDAGSNILMTAGKEVNTDAGSNIKSVAGKAMNIEAGTTISIDAKDKSVNIDNSTFLKTKFLDQIVKKDMAVKADNINQTADTNIRTTAKKDILISAKQKMDQRGGKMDISTMKGNLRLNGKTKTEVKGKQVKIN